MRRNKLRRGQFGDVFDEFVDMIKAASAEDLSTKKQLFFSFSFFFQMKDWCFKSLGPVTGGRVSYFLAVGS